MREASKDPKRLQDILEAIDNIFQYAGDDDMITVTSDKMRYHAIVYNMMIIGEAANLLSIEFRQIHPITPWRQITGMRNFLIHGYHQVETDLVWKVIDEDLHLLRSQVVDYLEELKEQE
jgi:uncharacterized protein with HEPN domain